MFTTARRYFFVVAFFVFCFHISFLPHSEKSLISTKDENVVKIHACAWGGHAIDATRGKHQKFLSLFYSRNLSHCLFYTVDCSFQSLPFLQLTMNFIIKRPLHVRLPFALNTTQKFPPPELLGPLLQLTSSFMI